VTAFLHRLHELIERHVERGSEPTGLGEGRVVQIRLDPHHILATQISPPAQFSLGPLTGVPELD
jgi:hypothetical protein